MKFSRLLIFLFIHLSVPYIQQKTDHEAMQELQPVGIQRVIDDMGVYPEFHKPEKPQAERIHKISLHTAFTDAVAEKGAVVFPGEVR